MKRIVFIVTAIILTVLLGNLVKDGKTELIEQKLSSKRAMDPRKVVLNPGPFVATLTGGFLAIGDNEFPIVPECEDGFDNDYDDTWDFESIRPDQYCDDPEDNSELRDGIQDYVPPTLSGSVDKYGNVSIPDDGVNMPDREFCVLPPLIPNQPCRLWGTLVFEQTAPGYGYLNPITGEVWIDLKLIIHIEGITFPWNDCRSRSDIIMHLSTGSSGMYEGKLYSSTNGSFTVVDNEFIVPEFIDCGIWTGPINEFWDLPTESGEATAVFEGVTDPVFFGPYVIRKHKVE